MTYLLFAVPLLFVLISLFLNKNLWLDILVLLHALLQLGLGVGAHFRQGLIGGMDRLGLFIYLITSLLYTAVALYRLGGEPAAPTKSYRIHSICLMLFVAAMDGACLAKDLGLIWIFVETTTLASAMLISFEHRKASLEAAWKYLFICSVGIALAFVGILLLVIAQPEHANLNLANLIREVGSISPFWLRMAFVFIMVGFGTKIGLAPLHFWLPDAHSEAPAPISALLSGALLNTALIPILRFDGLMRAAGLGASVRQIYMLMGILSIFVAAVFMLKTKNYKRLLAYSSIENMGLVMLAFGAGGIAVYAGFLHILGHSLVKAAFFLSAGNVVALYHDKHYHKVSGLLETHKASGWLWLISYAMIIGMPPSPLFISEFLIATALIQSGNWLILTLLLILLAVIAWGLGKASLMITMGKSGQKQKLQPLMVIAPASLLLLAAVIGIWQPALPF
ncbi:MAG: proton-conducting transporter membrane subunit [Candidatus Cloacimonetes bacterium]|nr:proton-conducting transporter membrane subunit [Candidatus Cloacimonadota bacterium]